LSSSWRAEILAVLKKEARSELRSKSGLYTALLFDISALIAAAFASSTQTLTPGAISAFLWIVLLFAAVVSLPRAFIIEEEQGTGDLLRLMARPHAVFWGKALFNLAFMAATAILLSFLFLILLAPEKINFGLYFASLVAGCAALAGVVSLCGALAAQAAHRFMLAGAIAVPLIVPLLALAVSASQAALGGSALDAGWRAAGGLAAYAVASFAIGPHLFAVVWKS
jgi:heme exporter protein B